MDSESIIDFENQQNSCRCCLKEFDVDSDDQIVITPIIQRRFAEITQLDLIMNEMKYSSVICESCNKKLRFISAFRSAAVEKQLYLYQVFENDTVKSEMSNSVEVKTEPDTEMIESVEYLDEFEDNKEAMKIFYPEDDFSSVRSSPIAKHRKQKIYKRALCGLCGKYYHQLQRHIDKVHFKVKRFFCDICGFGSFLKCNLSSHMAKHIAKEFRLKIECPLPECSSKFTRHESLKNHMKTEHEENPEILKCFCGKEFNLRHKLTTHVKRTHKNQRDHPCTHQDCTGKSFFTPKELKNHVMKLHTPGHKTEFHFCEICGKKYSSSKSLRTHKKHHTDKEFKCSFENCNKGFISKLLLANHEKIHLGQRDAQCHLCTKSFFSANHLRRHISVSHEKVKVNCFIENCRFSVGRKDYLRNHIILAHRELTEEVKNEILIKIRDMKI